MSWPHALSILGQKRPHPGGCGRDDAVWRPSLPTEGDRLTVKCDEPVIGDGHSTCESGQVVQQVIGAAERRFR